MDATIVVAQPALVGFAQATAAVGQAAAPADLRATAAVGQAAASPDLPAFQVVNPLVEAVAQNVLAPGHSHANIISNFVFDLQTRAIVFKIMDVNTRQVFFQVTEAAQQRVAAFNGVLAANSGFVQNQIGTA